MAGRSSSAPSIASWERRRHETVFWRRLEETAAATAVHPSAANVCVSGVGPDARSGLAAWELPMKTASPPPSPSALIDQRIKELADWRGEMLAHLRELIHQADPGIVEEWKWRGVPVFEHAGIVCTGESYKSVVKLTFAKGAALEDPAGLFNSSLDGNVRRAIDFREGEGVDAPALQALIRAAVALNLKAKSKPRPAKKTSPSSGS